MDNQISESAKRWLAEAKTLALAATERRHLLDDRVARFGGMDAEDRERNATRMAELNDAISASVVRLRHVETESDVPVGCTALLGTHDVPAPVTTALGILGAAGLCDTIASDVQSVGMLVELAGGDDVEALVQVRLALGSGGILRPVVSFWANDFINESGAPALCENAWRTLVGLEPDPAYEPEQDFGPLRERKRR